MSAKVEQVYMGKKLIGTITEKSTGFEARKAGVPVDSTTGWTRYGTRREALAALRRAAG